MLFYEGTALKKIIRKQHQQQQREEKKSLFNKTNYLFIIIESYRKTFFSSVINAYASRLCNKNSLGSDLFS